MYAIIQAYRKEKSRLTKEEMDKSDLWTATGKSPVHDVEEEEE
jgi:hypothetical protein